MTHTIKMFIKIGAENHINDLFENGGIKVLIKKLKHSNRPFITFVKCFHLVPKCAKLKATIPF